MNGIVYQAVLFNIDRPAEPSQAKEMFITRNQYENIRVGNNKLFQLGESVYEVQSWRAFDMTSELFGTRHMIVIDLKKK